MKPSNAHVIALVIVLAGLVVSPAKATPATVRDLQPLSSAPFAHPCTPPGDVESDTRIAVNPTDSRNIVASWNGFAPGGTVVGVSMDGGQSWKQVVVPGHAGCSGAEAESFAADPGLAFDADGTLYVASLNRTGESKDERVLISRSTTGGETWEDARELRGVVTDGLKENHLLWLTTNRRVSGRAYAVWTSYRNAHPRGATAAFSQTTDGGESWSSAKIIYSLLDPCEIEPCADNVDARGFVLRVLADGSLVGVFKQIRFNAPDPRWEIKAIRCVDDCDQGEGAWSPTPVQIGTACNDVPRDPDTKIPVSEFREPSLDVAPDGTAYAAWDTVCGTDDPTSRLLVARSTDGGITWAEPREVKREVKNVCPDGSDHPDQAHMPTVTVADNGSVGVTYYDFRHDCPGDGELTTNVWFAHSHDRGITWEDVHLAGPFDMRAFFDPFFEAFAVTGFNGLAGLSSAFAASFVQSSVAPSAAAHEPPTDIFFACVLTSDEKTTGGGWLTDRGGERINFAFTATDACAGPEGDLRLNDPVVGVKIHVTEVGSLGGVGTQCGSVAAGADSLELRGSGTYNGAHASFRVCVQDRGEPGAGLDRFSLACTSGCSYTTGLRALDEVIDGGNIQVGEGAGGGDPRPATVILDPLFLSEASIGQALTFTIKVYDQRQEPLANTSVLLTRTTAGGGVQSLSALTDASGAATILDVTLTDVAEYRARAGNAESNAIELTPRLG